jgi:6-phosphogluconolactonase
MNMTKIEIFTSPTALTRATVTCFVEQAQKAIEERGRFSVALSGGSTPRAIYQELAKPNHQTGLDWERIHLFWGDERHVPPVHPDSNFKMVKDALLAHIAIPETNIYRVPAELDVQKAAADYDAGLRVFFTGDWPQFDLVFLGMGNDGHTASLFPYSSGLDEEVDWFIANQLPDSGEWRLTLTKNAINAARKIVILVQGASKATMLAEVITGPYKPEEKPVQLISPVDGDLVWMVDAEAASQLPRDVRTNLSNS